MTPAERRRDYFIKNVNERAAEIAKEMVEKATKAYDALTDDEREKFDNPNRPWHIVQVILMVVADASIQKFSAEAIKPLIPQIKRILNKRCY